MATKSHLRPLHGCKVTNTASLFLFLALFFPGLSVQAQAPSNGSSNHQHTSPKFNPSTVIIIVLLVSAFFFLFFFSIYTHQCGGRDRETSLTASAGTAVGRSRRQLGLDPAVIESFPILVYSEVKKHKVGKTVLECAVCINEFVDDDTIRLLTMCDHVFHQECIDIWLTNHVTCPVCRTNYAAQSKGLPPAVRAETTGAIVAPAPAPAPSMAQQEEIADAPMSNHVANSLDVVVEKNEEIKELARIASRVKGNGSRRSKRLSRSHSTGHSLVLDGQERYTLRLPENIRKDIITGYAERTASRISRGIGEGSSRRCRTIQLGRSDRRPSFSLSSHSARIPAWGASRRREEAPSGKEGSKRWKLSGLMSGKDLLANRGAGGGDGSKTGRIVALSESSA